MKYLGKLKSVKKMLEALKVNNVMTVKHKTYVLFECPNFVANS